MKEKAVNLKRLGLKKVERVEKVQVEWEKSENANQVYSFIWHPRVCIIKFEFNPT